MSLSFMSNAAPFQFCHPCALVNKEVINKLKSFHGKPFPEPWKSCLESLQKDTPVNYQPSPIENVNIAAYGAGAGHKEFTKDGEQCVQQVVMYLATGNNTYADNAIKILMAWSTTCRIFTGSNAPLECGWGGCSMVRAAEILKHSCPLWGPKIDVPFQKFLDKIILPNLKAPLGWTNNWQTTICEARMQIAIFRNDKAEFDWAIKEYRRILKDYVMPTGQTKETLRDLVHAQFGLGSLIQIPELAYHHGVDLFMEDNCLMHKAMEFHADLLLGNLSHGITKEQIKEPWFLPCGWEIALHHYNTRLKLPMPKTTALLSKKRPEKYVFHWGLGSLTHYCHACTLHN
jgi:hypothetical protein